MEIDRAFVTYFSGTGTTARYAKAFAGALPCRTQTVDLGAKETLGGPCGGTDLLVLAAPVYGGRIPPFVWQRLEGLQGDDTPAVILAVYGARDYDDALLEMQTHLADKGFVTVAAAALVARHSIVTSIASGRPTADDLGEAEAFAGQVATRIGLMDSISDAPTLTFQGDLTPREGPGGPFPEVSEACTECGICADRCPAGAISHEAPTATDVTRCISCMRCIDVCPSNARKLPDQLMEMVTQMLSQACDPKKPNEFF